MLLDAREDDLELAPVAVVNLPLLGDGEVHEHEVAHEVGAAQALARGVHGLEDELWLVAVLRELDGDHLQAPGDPSERPKVLERGDTKRISGGWTEMGCVRAPQGLGAWRHGARRAPGCP